MFKEIVSVMDKPKLYEKGTVELWTDEHISKGMLESHLNPDVDAATRKQASVRETVKWIRSNAPVENYNNLLDLGCGPGIYAEEFYQAGYKVSGLDFSARSIGYAKNSAQEKNLSIDYHCQSYLGMEFVAQFDLITLIYYDFGVLSAEERTILLEKVFTALKPGGRFILDVLKPQYFSGREEYRSWEYAEKGFFASEPHLCLHSFYRYEKQNTVLDQHIIITEEDVRYINNFQHTFTREEIMQELNIAGFDSIMIYGDITGSDYQVDGKEMCVVAQKEFHKAK